MNDPRLDALARYRANLEAVLALLDGEEDPAGNGLRAAWRSCATSFEAFREQHAGRSESPELRASMDDCRRLNAVAVAEVQRTLERTTEQLVSERKERGLLRALQQAHGESQSGGSCDVQG